MSQTAWHSQSIWPLLKGGQGAIAVNSEIMYNRV